MCRDSAARPLIAHSAWVGGKSGALRMKPLANLKRKREKLTSQNTVEA